MDWAKLKIWCGWLLSPSRMVAERNFRTYEKVSYCDVLKWNLFFQAITVEIYCFSIGARFYGSNLPSFIYVIVGFYAFSRINELVLAFFGDAIDRLNEKTQRFELSKSERIKLLASGYVEVIFQFGLLHLAAQALSSDCAYKPLLLRDAFDAAYFSAMTITTTGFGDIAPYDPLPRLVTMYEAVIGIVFLALALGSYLSFTVKPKDAGKAGDDTGAAPPS